MIDHICSYIGVRALHTSLEELVAVAAEEDEVVLDEVDEDLPMSGNGGKGLNGN